MSPSYLHYDLGMAGLLDLAKAADPEYDKFAKPIELRKLSKPNIIAAIKTDERRDRILSHINSNGKFLEIQDARPGKVVLCCYGPSLNDHLQQIGELKASGAKVCTVSGAHNYIRVFGITPDYHVEMDPRNHKVDFVSRWNPETEYLLATSCHPDMYKALEGANVTRWNVWTDHGDEAFYAANPGNHFCLDVGSVVGLGALVVLCVMGYRDFEIFGMDCSLREGSRHASHHTGKPQRVQPVLCNDRWFESTPQMVGAMSDFFALVPRLGQVNINMHGDGLLQYRLQKLMEKHNAA